MSDFDEERANLYQLIAAADARIEQMLIWRDESELNNLSLRVAHLIEDEYAKHHDGGRSQRIAKTQLIVREAVRECLIGSRQWDAWQPGKFVAPPRYPEGS